MKKRSASGKSKKKIVHLTQRETIAPDSEFLPGLEQLICKRGPLTRPPKLPTLPDCPPREFSDLVSLPVLWAGRVCGWILGATGRIKMTRALWRHTFRDPWKERRDKERNQFNMSYNDVLGLLGLGTSLLKKVPEHYLKDWEQGVETLIRLALFGFDHITLQSDPEHTRVNAPLDPIALRIYEYFFDRKDSWLSPWENPGLREGRSQESPGDTASQQVQISPNFFWSAFIHLTVPARYIELGRFYAHARTWKSAGVVINISGYSRFYGGADGTSAIDHIWSGFREVLEAGGRVVYVCPSPIPRNVLETLKQISNRASKLDNNCAERVLLMPVDAASDPTVSPYDNAGEQAETWSQAYFAAQWRYTATCRIQDGTDFCKGGYVNIRTALFGGILHRSTQTIPDEESAFWQWVKSHFMPRLPSAQPIAAALNERLTVNQAPG